ncbi:hypothetical protein HY772_01610, partial [Candidatus Woesearchaeota archaeon]|nr:hypothetical protein [Candidatus Woesearchaeota archaeon]
MRPIMSVVIILLLVAEVSAIEPVSNIIEQTNAPIQVMSYYSLYRERAKYTTEGIHHTVEYKNVTDKTIVAVSIGLVSFSVWNEFMDHTNGMAIRDISPGLPDKGVW